MPQLQFGRFHFLFHFRGLGCHSSHAIATTNKWFNSSADCRVHGGTLVFRSRISLSLSRRRPVSSVGSGLGPVIAHRPPSLRDTPPPDFFLVQPGHLPVSALRSTCGPSRACASSRGRNPPTPTGAWCQMVTLPPTPDAATELPAQAGLVAAAAAAAVSPGPAVEGTPPPPRHPSRSMARLRLGYTKSRTGCLRCKQRRVKVAPVTPHNPRLV